MNLPDNPTSHLRVRAVKKCTPSPPLSLIKVKQDNECYLKLNEYQENKWLLLCGEPSIGEIGFNFIFYFSSLSLFYPVNAFFEFYRLLFLKPISISIRATLGHVYTILISL